MQATITDKIEQQREHFEKVSPRYYTSRQSKNHLLLKELMWDYFLHDKPFLKKEGMRVLEPMCGYAEGKDILEKHLNVTIIYEGFDYSETLIDIVKKQNPLINIRKLDITRFNAMREYDLIILIGGLHHVYSRAGEAANRIALALKDGGFFINLEPTYNNPIVKWVSNEIYRRNALFDHETERRFDVKELNDIYQSNNLKLVDQIYPGLLSYILYYNPDAFPYLDIGKGGLTRFLFGIDRLFFRNFIGCKFSFATLSLLKKS